MDGEWSLPDEFLLSIVVKAQQDGVFHKTFYDGQVANPYDFIVAMQEKTNYPVFGFWKNEPLGFAWLNGVTETHAMVHFCVLQTAWGKLALQAAKAAIAYWMEAVPQLEVLTGFTPANNKSAVRFIEKVGFVRAGEIPRMLKDVYSGETVPAVISYYLRN